MSSTGTPARGYSWPPFAPGHTSSVKHGAESPRLVSQRAERLLEEVAADRPSWLGEVDGSAVRAWAYAEARCAMLREWTDQHGLLDDRGRPTHAATLLLQCERQAADARARLGFEPLSRARLGRDTAVARAAVADGIEAVRAAGRATERPALPEATDDIEAATDDSAAAK